MSATSEPRPLFQINGLGKSFGSARQPLIAVGGVSFTIHQGETLGLVGESGSGKSTIGRLLTRLTEATTGEILYQNQPDRWVDLARLSQRQMRPYRSDIQIIFQDPYASFNPRMKVGDILGEALDTHGLAAGAARQPRIAELLDQVGLRAEHAARYPHHFSGGQRQRIGIARALAVQPRFIVADEPLSALDVSVQAQVVNLLSDLKAQLGLTLLFISHDLEVVEYLCDRVIVLYLGRIMEVAPVRDLYRNPQHPYSQALLAAAPVPDPKLRGSPRIRLEGDIPSPLHPPSGCVFRTRCPKAIADCATTIPQLRPVGNSAERWSACILTPKD
ncbi:MAG: ATP-binding cassette domain-containing protein [Alphaproteobacteria bacterium]|nr:ATP-binding cassette domain-containing protein [Alphaproteobacteria bacterium]